MRDELRGRVDAELRRDVTETFDVPLLSSSDPPRLEIRRSADGAALGARPRQRRRRQRRRAAVSPPGPLGGRSLYAQLVDADGAGDPAARAADQPARSVAEARAVAAGDRAPFFSETRGRAARTCACYTAQTEPGRAIQVARSLDEVDDTLEPARASSSRSSASAGSRSPAALGLLVARAALAPVERLRRAAEEVASTRDLSRRIDASGGDELGRARRQLQRDARRARATRSTPSASSSPTPRTSCARR